MWPVARRCGHGSPEVAEPGHGQGGAYGGSARRRCSSSPAPRRRTTRQRRDGGPRAQRQPKARWPALSSGACGAAEAAVQRRSSQTRARHGQQRRDVKARRQGPGVRGGAAQDSGWARLCSDMKPATPCSVREFGGALCGRHRRAALACAMVAESAARQVAGNVEEHRREDGGEGAVACTRQRPQGGRAHGSQQRRGISVRHGARMRHPRRRGGGGRGEVEEAQRREHGRARCRRPWHAAGRGCGWGCGQEGRAGCERVGDDYRGRGRTPRRRRPVVVARLARAAVKSLVTLRYHVYIN